MTKPASQCSLAEVGVRVCLIVAEQLGLAKKHVHLDLRLIEDLHCDSLDLIELLMEIEDEFGIELGVESPDPVVKAVFTRSPFRLSDLAEAVYVQQGRPRIKAPRRWKRVEPATLHLAAFTQLGGREIANRDLRHEYESLGKNACGCRQFRRRLDGMVCVEVPAAEPVIGSDAVDALEDERPAHRVQLDAFLMDIEPVSTTAHSRFLNSAGVEDAAVLQEWFQLPAEDHRRHHELLRKDPAGEWGPLPGTERFPMVLVSWYGANAYSLWAHRQDFRSYRDEKGRMSRLPSEAQWEYAAQGAAAAAYPWGDEPPTPQRARFAQHRPGTTYRPETMPMAEVQEELGMSSFGLRHMAGNVWQWCGDGYRKDFYLSEKAREPNVVAPPAPIRSERGGSWVGPGFLCRSSFRRGRVPTAKGRCLGFRCVTDHATL
jgi:acyl carrier protein